MCAPKAVFGVTFLFFPFLPVPSISSSQAHKPCLMLLRATFWPSNSPLRHVPHSLVPQMPPYTFESFTYNECTFNLICEVWVWLLLICQTPFSHRLGPNSSHATPIQRNWNISNIFHNCQSPISSFSPPGSESNYAGFIFDGNFSKPGLARHQIKWKFVISFKYAKAFRICRSIQGPKYEQVMKFSA